MKAVAIPGAASILRRGGWTNHLPGRDVFLVTRCVAHRLYAALLVLGLAIGLPVQAAQASAMDAHTVLAASTDLPMPDGCGGGGDDASLEAGCPVLLCLVLATAGEHSALTLFPSTPRASLEQTLRRGLSVSPDPSPPRPILPV